MSARFSRRHLAFGLPLAATVGLGGVFLFGLGRDPNHVPSHLIDKPAPRFDLPRLAGGRFTDADLTDAAPKVVNFFASWCGPCRLEHPHLEALAKEAPVYGVAWRDAPERAQAFLDELGDPFLNVGVDRENRVGVEFGLYGVPETYILSADGRILWRYAGPVTQDVVDREMRPLLR